MSSKCKILFLQYYLDQRQRKYLNFISEQSFPFRDAKNCRRRTMVVAEYQTGIAKESMLNSKT